MRTTDESEERIYHVSEILPGVILDIISRHYSNIPLYEEFKDLSKSKSRLN